MRLQELCSKYNIRFKKQLGQNLLVDDNINRIMVDAAALTGEDDVLEIGAGLGALTAHLLERAGRVLAVEIDRAFMPCLEERFGDAPNVRLFRGDILNHPVEKLLAEHLPGCRELKAVANLPYYITTPILFHLWESRLRISRIVVMVQEEVAQRLTAPVGAHEYGLLALAAAYHGAVDIVHRAPRTCFRPQPKVDSCIVRLRSHDAPLYPDLDARFLSSLMRAAFAQRRKTLRNSLTRSGAFGASREAVTAAFEAAGIDPERRPQTMSLDEFARLAREVRTRIQAPESPQSP